MEDNTRDCRYCRNNESKTAKTNNWCPKLNTGECKIIGATTHTAFEPVSDEERVKIDKDIKDREIKVKAHNIAFNLALTLRIIHDSSDIIFFIAAVAHWVRTPDLTFMQNIIGAMLMAFSFIIAIISMIIIYFRITNSIEQNITNIGALKALGYTSQQIRQSMILEFLLTTGVAVALGIGAFYMVVPIFEKLMRSSSGVMWDHAFDPIAFAITLIFILGTVLLVATVSTRNIIKLDPVIALRFGLNDSNFKINHAPVEYTPGPLTWIMALKSVLGNTKQNVILVVVGVADH